MRMLTIILLLCTLLGISRAACPASKIAQFQCSSGGKCVDMELTCNGVKDCSDGSDEALKNCTDGCPFNRTTVKSGETGQDVEWWYSCSKSRWIISGCVVNGQRFKDGEQFQMLTRQGVFWGKCEKLDQYHYSRQPYGCVDSTGKNVENGQPFQMNQLFWGVCSLNRTTMKTPQTGSIQVNDVKWKIVGCNDGSKKPVQDGQEFIWIIDPFRLLGVQIKCQLPQNQDEWPDIKPTACVVNVQASSATSTPTPAPSFKILRDKCYMQADKLIYYCTITPKTVTIPPQLVGKISSWDDDWLLNITNNNANELAKLKKNGLSECSESPKVQPVVPQVPLPPPLPPQAGAQPQGTAKQQGKREAKFSFWRNVEKRSSGYLGTLVSSRMSAQLIMT